jgi:hypothetical protein
VLNLARRSSLVAGSTREKKGEEERRNVRNFVWQFGTGNRKYQWHARAYPERGAKWFYHSNLLSSEAVKARWVWAGPVAKYLLRPRGRCSSPRPAPRRCRNRRITTRQMRSGED